MSALTATNVLRPKATGLKGWLMAQAMAAAPFFLGLARRFMPLPKFGNLVIATLHDDVREVFGTDAAFSAPYTSRLDVITGGQPFFLGMQDGPQYRTDLAAVQKLVRPGDLARLAKEAEASAEACVLAGLASGAGGKIEVVDQLVRKVTFDVLAKYLGVPPAPGGGDLRVWATRLFEYQFVDQGPEITAEVNQIAPAFRAHIQAEIVRRRGEKSGPDDLLGRALKLQAAKDPWYTDDAIRTAILCLVVGGPPQPPMVVPQAMEQLLRRPDALAGAQAAAKAGDDELLRRYVLEAMRFDPLAPGLPRQTVNPWTLAAGTKRARTVPVGATVFVAFASAMRDERRLPDPETFRIDRLDYEYIHFGYGLHQCFGRHINHATLHLMLKPLLKRDRLRRAAGADGRLSKNGPFAERLVVEYA